MGTPIINVNNVSIFFNLEEQRTDTIKEYVIKLLKGKLKFNKFYALKDVSFSVNKGDSIGLIGINGSGKSTMLKIIAGVLYPSSGTVSVNGTIAPMIELGAGFDGELTGRENIYLNGAVLGHDRNYMNSHFNEIVDFSELGDFIDVPVKNYSSGMTARLGFSIATIVCADILIVDEVLAVGDFKFQKKCRDRMRKMMDEGTTILFVSHDEDQVKSLCKRAIWIDHGKILDNGDTDHVYKNFHKKYG